MCLSTQIFIQKMAIFIGNEPFLLRVVIVFVYSGWWRSVEKSTEVTPRLKDKISSVCGYFQTVQTSKLYIDLSNFLVLGQLNETIS